MIPYTVLNDNTADYGQAIAQYSSCSVYYENDGGLQFTSRSDALT